MPSRRPWTAGACLLVGLLALDVVACRSIGPMTEAEARPKTCAECHVEVAAEWHDSAHARAWTSESFRVATDDHRRTECLGCHAPTSLFAGTGPPTLRSTRREDGVDCQACHLAPDGVLVGPHAPQRDGFLQPHPVRKTALVFRQSELCGRCHEKTLADVERYSEGRTEVTPTCQSCHMPLTVRKLTQGGLPLPDRLEKPRRQRRHTFNLSGLKDAKGAVDVAATFTRGDDIVVEATLTNQLRHRIPTGERRLARLSIRALSRDGEELGSVVREFGEGTLRLVPAEPHRVRGQLPAAATRLKVRFEIVGQPGLLLHESEIELN